MFVINGLELSTDRRQLARKHNMVLEVARVELFDSLYQTLPVKRLMGASR